MVAIHPRKRFCIGCGTVMMVTNPAVKRCDICKAAHNAAKVSK